MDSAGKLLIGQETGSLEEGDHHDPRKVKDFLARWVVEPKDAQVVLRDALARASSEDKKVFLTFGAPWCGWCHRLENFLARPEIAAILDRDFVVLKIDTDRMTHGKDVLNEVPSRRGRRNPLVRHPRRQGGEARHVGPARRSEQEHRLSRRAEGDRLPS